MENTSKNYKFVMTSMFAAIIFILAFTPIGFIQLGIIKTTIIHVPVILGSILLGPSVGAVLGGLFGVTSLVTNTMMPALLSFAFSPFIPVPGTGEGSWLALIVCFIPRILVGIVPYYVYKAFRIIFSSKRLDWVSLSIAGIVGSLTNTILVLGLLYFFFQDAYATAKNISTDAVMAAIMTIVAVNGVPEAIVAAIIITALGKVLMRFVVQKR
jgi:uncharacterized membrane protein